MVFIRDAQQVGDDLGGQRLGERLDELDRPRACMLAISLSTMAWMNGRRLSTRLTVKLRVTMRRSRSCSGASSRRNDLSALSATIRPSKTCGYPGRSGSALNLGWASTTRMSLYRVSSHGVLPSHSRTRVTGSFARSSAYCGGGSNGQVRCIG